MCWPLSSSIYQLLQEAFQAHRHQKSSCNRLPRVCFACAGDAVTRFERVGMCIRLVAPYNNSCRRRPRYTGTLSSDVIGSRQSLPHVPVTPVHAFANSMWWPLCSLIYRLLQKASQAHRHIKFQPNRLPRVWFACAGDTGTRFEKVDMGSRPEASHTNSSSKRPKHTGTSNSSSADSRESLPHVPVTSVHCLRKLVYVAAE